MPNPTGKGRIRIVTCLALALFAAGCSDEGGPQSQPSPRSAPPETTTTTLPPVALPEDSPSLRNIVPAPVSARPDDAANFALRPETGIEVSAEGQDPAAAREVGRYLAGALKPATGYELPVDIVDEARPSAVALRLAGGEAGIKPQGYRLEVRRDGVTITATDVAGLFNGAHTLRQLLPADIERPERVERQWVIAGGVVSDQPRFGYRGTLLDVARHFFPADVVKRHIDRIAQYKINYLHLHLADDQGWRLEIKSWPKLATVGGQTQVGGGQGGYYTQEQYRDIVAYAAARGVTIVPEIDMPGHTNAALTAYPELNCSGQTAKPYTDTQVGFSSLCIRSEETYRFAKDVIGEVAGLTPGPYVHIGGDEAQSTTDADYKRFFTRVLPMVEDNGKRALGWHEYAKAGPPKSAVVQYWRIEQEESGTRAAAANGNKVLMSPANKTYLDMKYSPNDPWGNKWAGPVGVRTSYDWDPARFLSGVGEGSVVGVEAPLWTELVETEDDIERMAFPRIPAIAEVGWTAQANRSWQAFSGRLAEQGERLSVQGIAFHRSPEVPW